MVLVAFGITFGGLILALALAFGLGGARWPDRSWSAGSARILTRARRSRTCERLTMALALRRARSMPFGAEARDDGVTGFRLWAPVPTGWRCGWTSGGAPCPCPGDPQGWAALATTEAPPGTRYRYQIDGEFLVPDPASRFQPDGVHGPSEVVDPLAYSWSDGSGRDCRRAAGVLRAARGTFTRAGTLAAAAERIDHLAALGVTAVGADAGRRVLRPSGLGI